MTFSTARPRIQTQLLHFLGSFFSIRSGKPRSLPVCSRIVPIVWFGRVKGSDYPAFLRGRSTLHPPSCLTLRIPAAGRAAGCDRDMWGPVRQQLDTVAREHWPPGLGQGQPPSPQPQGFLSIPGEHTRGRRMLALPSCFIPLSSHKHGIR